MSFLKNDFIYGICGGFTGTIISHPFDTIKTRIQSNNASSIAEAIQMKKLYAGITPPLIGIMLEKSIVFGFYNKAKEHKLNDFFSGIIGGFMCTLIVTPIDRLKINFQNKQPVTSNTLKTMYKGFIPTICRETPGFGIYFTTYQYCSDMYNKNRDLGKSFLFGAFSGLTAWTFIYPSDLVKTKIQSSNSPILIKDMVLKIYHENNIGFRNFYKGFSLAIMRAMPLHGGVFVGYELSKKYITN